MLGKLFKRKGFSVKPTGRAGLLYSENGRTLSIYSEMLAGDEHDMVVYLSRVEYWDAPDDSTKVTEEDLERIRQSISESMNASIEWA